MADFASYQAFIELLENSTLAERSQLVGLLALMLYEISITFDREVELFWGMPFTRTTLIFLLNRYISLMKYPVALASLGVTAQKGCNVVNMMGGVVELIPYLLWAIFSAMRVYALSERNAFLGIIVLLLLCVPIGTNVYSLSISTAEYLGGSLGCITLISIPSAQLNLALLLVTRLCAILGDAIVITVTWYKTYRVWRAAVSAGMKLSLSEMIIRDSSIYFVVLLAINVFHIAATLTSVFKGSVASFEEPLASIMISRAMLNLREVDQSPRDAASGPDGTLVFEPATHSVVLWGDGAYHDGYLGGDLEGGPICMSPSSIEDSDVFRASAASLDWEEEHDAQYRSTVLSRTS